MSDSTPAPALSTADLDTSEAAAYFEDPGHALFVEDLKAIRERLRALEDHAGPLHQSNGRGLFHALFRTKEGRISREKFLAFLMTAGPLVLLPFLQDIGVNPVLLNGAGTWFVANGGSKWIARHQRDLPVDVPG